MRSHFFIRPAVDFPGIRLYCRGSVAQHGAFDGLMDRKGCFYSLHAVVNG